MNNFTQDSVKPGMVEREWGTGNGDPGWGVNIFVCFLFVGSHSVHETTPADSLNLSSAADQGSFGID